MRNELNSLWHAMLDDWRGPDFLWQVAVLAACFAIAWLASRVLEDKRVDALGDNAIWRLGRGGLRRIAFPLAAALLVLAARPFVRANMGTHLLSLALPLLFSLAGIRMVFYVLRQSFSQSAWLSNFERVFAFAVWGLVAMHIVGVLPELIELFEAIKLPVGKQQLSLWQAIQATATVLATVLGALWVSGLIEARLNAAEGLDVNLREVFARLTKALMIVVAVLISLPLVGIDLTTLSVFGGALGVGLGFGMQKIASNYVSGFIILLERSIRIGNMISVGDQRGEVTRITTRFTVLKGHAGVESLVPNEFLVGQVVQNESYSSRQVRTSLPLQIGYESDLERAMALLIEICAAQPRVLAEPPPQVLVKQFADSGIELELGCWIEDPENGTGQLKSDIYLAIWRCFRSEGIVIPYPHREVRLVGAAAPEVVHG